MNKGATYKGTRLRLPLVKNTYSYQIYKDVTF